MYIPYIYNYIYNSIYICYPFCNAACKNISARPKQGTSSRTCCPRLKSFKNSWLMDVDSPIKWSNFIQVFYEPSRNILEMWDDMRYQKQIKTATMEYNQHRGISTWIRMRISCVNQLDMTWVCLKLSGYLRVVLFMRKSGSRPSKLENQGHFFL